MSDGPTHWWLRLSMDFSLNGIKKDKRQANDGDTTDPNEQTDQMMIHGGYPIEWGLRWDQEVVQSWDDGSNKPPVHPS